MSHPDSRSGVLAVALWNRLRAIEGKCPAFRDKHRI